MTDSNTEYHELLNQLLEATLAKDSSTIQKLIKDNHNDNFINNLYQFNYSLTETFTPNRTHAEELNLIYLYENYLTYFENNKDDNYSKQMISYMGLIYDGLFGIDLTEDYVNDFMDKILASLKKTAINSFNADPNKSKNNVDFSMLLKYMVNTGNSFYEQRLSAITPIEIKTFTEFHENHMNALIKKMDDFLDHPAFESEKKTLYSYASRISMSKKEQFLDRIIDFDIGTVIDEIIKIEPKDSTESSNKYRIYLDPHNKNFQQIFESNKYVKQNISNIFLKLCEYDSQYNFLHGSKVINFNHQVSIEGQDFKTPTIFCELNDIPKDHLYPLIRKIGLDCLTDALVTGDIIDKNYFEHQINPMLRDIYLFKELAEVKATPVSKKKKI